MNPLRFLEAIHGHFGILAAASLLHPAILLRRGQQLSRGSRWALCLATAFAITAFSFGIGIYESYRTTVKRGLFLIYPRAGFLFETKEHLALVVVSLATGGLICALLAPPEARSLRKAAAASYFSAFVLASLVCVLGTYVAGVHSFAE